MWWQNAPITYRQHLVEEALTRGVPWEMAWEAVSSTLLEHPEIDGDEEKARQAWMDGRDGEKLPCCNVIEDEDPHRCPGTTTRRWPVYVCDTCRGQCGAGVHGDCETGPLV